MTKVEICLTICAFVMPFLALLFVLPKKISGKQEKPKETAKFTINKEEKKEETKPVESKLTEKPVEKKKRNPFEDVKYSAEDFRGYLNRRKENMTKPKHKTPKEDTTFSFADFMAKKSKEDIAPALIREDIHNLSPDLTAMMIAGVLDKKDFD